MCVSVRGREREELFNTNCLVWLCKQEALSLSRLDTHTESKERQQKRRQQTKGGQREKLCVCLREVGVLT